MDFAFTNEKESAIYRYLHVVTSTPISNRSPSHLGPRTKKEGTSSLKNKLASLTKVKDTMAATLENTRKEMSAIKEELKYTKEELGETRKRYEGSEERNKVQKSTAYTWLDCCCFNAAQIVLTPPAPRNGGPFLPFFGQAGQVDPLVGWRSCY